MHFLLSIALVLQIISAVVVIVLVHAARQGCRPRCAFGSGASGSVFGATGSANFLFWFDGYRSNGVFLPRSL